MDSSNQSGTRKQGKRVGEKLGTTHKPKMGAVGTEEQKVLDSKVKLSPHREFLMFISIYE